MLSGDSIIISLMQFDKSKLKLVETRVMGVGIARELEVSGAAAELTTFQINFRLIKL